MLRELVQKKPKAQLFSIGETDGDLKRHLDLIQQIKHLKPQTDTLFVEVSYKWNPTLSEFFKGNITADEVMRILNPYRNISSHGRTRLTREVLVLTKELGIRIVGIEDDPSTRLESYDHSWKTQNIYRSDRMMVRFPYALGGKDLSLEDLSSYEENFHTRQAIYIGNAKHMHYRSSQGSSPKRGDWDSVTDSVRDLIEIEVAKILVLRASEVDRSIQFSPSSFSSILKAKGPFAILPTPYPSVIFPEVPYQGAVATTLMEYDLVLVQP